MKEYLLESDNLKLKNNFGLTKEKCFCGEGFIYKIKKYEVAKAVHNYSIKESDEIKKITCEFCRNNYEKLENVKSTIIDICHLEDRLYDYYYDQEYENHNIELIEKNNKLIEEYKLTKMKLDKLNITGLASHRFTKREWAAYFVNNNLTDLNEKECYKQFFYGADKIGLDIFLNKVGISIGNYNSFLIGESLFLKEHKIQKIKKDILQKKQYLLNYEDFVHAILNHKDQIKDFNYIDVLEKLTEELKEQQRLKELEIDSDYYDIDDIVFHIEDALKYALNKFSDSNEEYKKMFIKEYISEILDVEYTKDDFDEDDFDFDE